MNEAQTCMGGWCRIREACTRYHARTALDPVDRLCDPGHDGACLTHRIVLIRRVARHDLPVVVALPEAA